MGSACRSFLLSRGKFLFATPETEMHGMGIWDSDPKAFCIIMCEVFAYTIKFIIYIYGCSKISRFSSFNLFLPG